VPDKLVIVESPSKAKTIKKYLGKGYQVIASQGHVIDLPASKFGVNLEADFKPEYITMKGKAKIISEIKKEAKGKEIVYLATDPDREGEAIAWHLKNLLKIDDSVKCRIEFHEITETAVKKAIKDAKQVNFNLVEAQQTRRVLDRIVGYKISPLLWKKIKKGLSAGRVQSVALKIIMDKEKEIRAFVPEEYWNLSVILKKVGVSKDILSKFYGDKKGKIALKNDKQTMEIVSKIDGKDYIVTDVKKSEKKKNPPPPFITSSLGQEGSRKLGFTMKKTMMVAQKLYEAGHITYMRTDSVRISQDAIAMAKDHILSKFSEKYYLNRVFKTKDSAQDAHEAIRPTNLDNIDGLLASLPRDEQRLMSLIYNRFLASQMQIAIYDTTKITLEVNNYVFVTTGSVIKFDGFMILYIEGKDDEENSDDDEAILPELNVGDLLKQKQLNFEQKYTEPPSRYTESTLVKILEEKGIGRPSTYAPTISTIEDRLYIEKEKKYLVPTNLGEVVNDLMENNFKNIVDEQFTANMESTLDRIAEGKETYIKTITDFYSPFAISLEVAQNSIEKVKLKEEVSEVICELCGKNMVVKQGKYGKFLACPGFPDCKNIKSIVQKIDIPCPKCGGTIVIKKTKAKRMFYVCENSPATCDYISWNKPKKEEDKT